MKILMSLEGIDVAHSNLGAIRRAVAKQGNTTSWNGAQRLYSRSRAVVPYQDGDLYESAYLEKDETSEDVSIWTVGYTAPHALIVHETPNRVHPTRGPSPEPKQDHYLSEPADAMVQEFPRTVRDDMRKAIEGTRLVRR